MTALPHFDAAAISAVVDMDSAIKALKEAFKDLGKLHPRTQVSLGTTDDLLLMPAVTSMGIGQNCDGDKRNPEKVYPLSMRIICYVIEIQDVRKQLLMDQL